MGLCFPPSYGVGGGGLLMLQQEGWGRLLSPASAGAVHGETCE